MTAATIDDMQLADEPAAWRALGFAVEGRHCQIGAVRLGFVGSGSGAGGTGGGGGGLGAGGAILGWSLRGVAGTELDGLPTTISERPAPAPSADGEPAPAHPNGVSGIDHVVAFSPSLDRTVAALRSAGLELRRIREQPTPAGAPRQAFFRLGAVILEVVQAPAQALASSPEWERAGGADAPARFWGLALVVADADRAAAAFAPHLSEFRPAVQAGRRIATVRRSAGLALPLALMSAEERAGDAGAPPRRRTTPQRAGVGEGGA